VKTVYSNKDEYKMKKLLQSVLNAPVRKEFANDGETKDIYRQVLGAWGFHVFHCSGRLAAVCCSSHVAGARSTISADARLVGSFTISAAGYGGSVSARRKIIVNEPAPARMAMTARMSPPP